MSMEQIAALKKLRLAELSAKSATQTEQADTTIPCICNRPLQDVLCHSCGYLFVGRVRKKCLHHPTEILLMDMSCCPKCKTTCLLEIKQCENQLREVDETTDKDEFWGTPIKSSNENNLTEITPNEKVTTVSVQAEVDATPKPKYVDCEVQTEFTIQVVDEPKAKLAPSNTFPTQLRSLSGIQPVQNVQSVYSGKSMDQKSTSVATESNTWQKWVKTNTVTSKSETKLSTFNQLPVHSNTASTPVVSSGNVSHIYIPRQPILSAPKFNPYPKDSSQRVPEVHTFQKDSSPVHRSEASPSQINKPVYPVNQSPGEKKVAGAGDGYVGNLKKNEGVSDELSILKRALQLRRSNTPEYSDQSLAERQF